MKYPYPKMTNTLIFKRVSEYEMYIKDCTTDVEMTVPLYDAWFLCQLDGYCDPYSFRDLFTEEEIAENLAFFDDCGVLRYENIRNIGFLSWLFPIIQQPFRSVGSLIAARVWNVLLMLSWLAVFVIGVLLFLSRAEELDFDFTVFGLFAGVILGMVSGLCLHEASHACASVSYGGRVFECGLFMKYLLGWGAYVLSDDADIKRRMQRVQLYAAGVETNFLLTGLFLIGAALIPYGSYGFTLAAFENLIMGLINLLPIDGVDGSRILALFLGISAPFDLAKQVTKSPRMRRAIRVHNRCGEDAIFLFYVLRIMQLLLPIFYIMSVLEIILCFL